MKPTCLGPSGFNPRRQAGFNACGLRPARSACRRCCDFPCHLQAWRRAFRLRLTVARARHLTRVRLRPRHSPVQTRFAPLAAASHRALVRCLCARSTSAPRRKALRQASIEVKRDEAKSRATAREARQRRWLQRPFFSLVFAAPGDPVQRYHFTLTQPFSPVERAR